MKSNRSLIHWQHWLGLVVLFWALLAPGTADTYAHDGGVRSTSARVSGVTADGDPTSPQVTVVTSSTDEIVLEVNIPSSLEFREVVENGVTYQRLSLPGTGTTTEIGRPELPAFGHFLAVPIGAELQLEILEETPSVPLPAARVYPVQPSQMDQGPEPPFELDADFYEQDVFYPPQTVTLDQVTTLRGINVSVVRFFPVQFNPAQGQLRPFSRLRVRISFPGSSGQFVDQRLWSPHFESTYQRLLLNYSLLETELAQVENVAAPPISISSADGADFLIITHPNFVAQANTLADWKRLKGIDTEVRTTTEIGTTADAIRGYILDAYNNWRIPPSFILLLGDAEYIPPHYITVHPWSCSGCWYPPGTRIGTDLYYADMTGNYYPELAIGRIPVDTPAQATTVVNKIINYERNPPATASFYSSALAAAFFQDEDYDHYEEYRYVKTSEEMRDFLLAQGYTVDRVYYAYPNVYPTHYNNGEFGNGEPLPDELLKPGFAWDGWTEDIQSAVNAGRFLVTHRDHGTSLNNGHSSVEGWLYPRWEAANVSGLSNGSRLPVVFSVNCETGYFDGETDFNAGTNTQSLSEALLLQSGGGAVGVIGATRISFSGYNDFMIRGFMDAIWPNFIPGWGSGTPEYRLGQILNIGKLGMVQFWGDPEGYQRVQFENFHYFGDPTMEIWTAFPGTLSVSHPATLSAGATLLTVNVAQDDALVSLVQNDVIIGTATSSGGHATLTFDPVSIGAIHVTVTKHNYVPYEGSSIAVVNDPPYEPSAPSPAHNATHQPVSVDLEWTGGDPDGNSVTYDVYLEANNSSPQALVSENQAGSSFDPGTLQCSADYYWRVVARDEHGATTSGDVWHFTTQTCAPLGAPTNLNVAAVSQTQINLTWWDNSSEESSFRIERSPNGSTGWMEIASMGTNVTSYQDAALACGTSYYYRVRAYREGDGQISDYSNAANTATQACPPPNAPSNLNTTAVSRTQINLSWLDNSADESGFRIERSPNGSTGWTQIASLGVNITSYQNTGLSCGTRYYYRARAYREGDGQTSGYSNAANTTTQACPPPNAPSNLNTTAVSRTQINLSWLDNSADESGFRIERSPNGSTGWTQIASVGANVTGYQNTGLSCGTRYYYRVRAYRNSDGQTSGYSNVANTTTHTCPPPNAPSDLNATAMSRTEINLSWGDNSADESGFRIERSPNGSTSWTQIASVGANVSSYQNSELVCGTGYYYRVRAYREGDGQISDYSNVANTATQACAPPNAPSSLNATAVSRTQIDLSWQDNSPDEAHFNIERSPNGSAGWTVIATVAANVSNYQNTGLSCGTHYYYRVCAYRDSDGQYSGHSVVAKTTTQACPIYLPSVLKNY